MALEAWRVEGQRLLALADASDGDEIAAAIDGLAERLRLAQQARPRRSRRLAGAQLSRAAVETGLGLALAYAEFQGLAALSGVSRAIRTLATADHAWKSEIARVYPEAECIRSPVLQGMKLFRRMLRVWGGLVDSGGPWDAPGVESYEVIAVVEVADNPLVNNCLIQGRFPLREASRGMLYVDVGSSVLYEDGWEVNLESLSISLALVRLADQQILHIATRTELDDIGGDEDNKYAYFQEGCSRLTTLCCGVAEDLERDTTFNVCLEHCTTRVDDDGDEFLTRFDAISISVFDPISPDQASMVSCRQLLDAVHTSNKWM